jgi:CBS domain containing-hemolysin-like protein
MTVNSLYFAIASVVLQDAEVSTAAKIGIGLFEVIALIALGEVLPKLVGNSLRERAVVLVAYPALVLHWLFFPVQMVIDLLIFIPIHRITAPSLPPSGPSIEELRDFVAVARVQGDITAEEESLLARLLLLRRTRVRDVMTHRTEMVSIPRTSTRADVISRAQGAKLKRLPVVEGSNDRIVGVLDVRRFLLDPKGAEASIEAHLQSPVFVPDIAQLEQLFDLFRAQRTSLAIVVDEFGGTAGIVALEDAVEEVVGDIVAADEIAPGSPEVTRAGTRIDGRMSASAFCSHFKVPLSLTRASTVAGIVNETLGNLPSDGQELQFGSLRLRVDGIERNRVRAVIVLQGEHGQEGQT